MKEISELGCVDLGERKLRKTVLEDYGIKTGVSQRDGKTIEYVFFPYRKGGEITAYKVRHLPTKNMWSVGDMKDVDLFGWDEAVASGAKRLIITEGEFDAPAGKRIVDMLTDPKFEFNKPAFCSIPNGAAGAGNAIARLKKKIKKHFQEVSFCFDDDEPGQDALDACMKVIPDATSITLPKKDLNDCIKGGVTKAAFKAIQFKHEKPKNTRIIWGKDLREEAKKDPEWGVSYPWATVTDATRGIRLGETVYIGAGVKMGKSEIVNALGAHLIKEHKWKILMAKPEEHNAKSYKMLAGKLVGKCFHDPKVPFDEKEFDRAGDMLDEHMAVINLYQHIGWESLKDDITEAAAQGCKAVFIDPITNLTNGMNAADANIKLQEIAQELSAMALDLNIVVFIFCHLRNPEGGKPHERGGKVLSSQFAGSRAMARSCNYMFGLEGDKDPELPDEQRNLRKLVGLEDREFGEVFECILHWNKQTQLFTEV